MLLTKEIKKSIKTWIKALRSGEYEQTQGTLHRIENGDKYCCLGVACRLFIKEKDLRLYYDNAKIFGVSPSEQPNAPEWLKDINNDFCNKIGYSLVSLNDSYKYSFNMIADLLELIYIHKSITKEDVKNGLVGNKIAGIIFVGIS